MTKKTKSTKKTGTVFGTKSSTVVEACQSCGNRKLESILFLGYLPPVNKMHAIGTRPAEQPAYPAELLRCPKCHLVQLGLVVDATVLFPPEYPYTSSTTKILRENFAELYSECAPLLALKKDDLVVDIGSNDGNLLSNFAGKHRVLGVTPEEIGKKAIARGIPTVIDYFRPEVVKKIVKKHGKASLITATNVFAHIEDVHSVIKSILALLAPGGTFISESHYLLSLIETLQYDTIYHEHLRYYSLHSLAKLLEGHDLEVFHARRIPTHGGSIRVYAARKGDRKAAASVTAILKAEKDFGLLSVKRYEQFRKEVVVSKLELHRLLHRIKSAGKSVYGISAPSRASTLINYTALDSGIIDVVLEVTGSHKIGKYVPGTLIPVEEESRLFKDQPDYALLFSWHIAQELAPKLKAKGFKGDFIIPLPLPRILPSSKVK